ncbi:hypothetical protein [Aquilutibacter rugosus]|uniref:hypothetical protein n=1 Tax=Aquilutibacter rugosus TaxID=3115820 RepID=UPI002F3ECE46
MNLEVNDVVQLSLADPVFAACFMVVTDPKPWGAQGYVRVPGGGNAYYRAKTENMEFIGKAVWVQPEDVPDGV